MSDNRNKNKGKPAPNTNTQPMPKNVSNEANHKGAIDLGTERSKATASQQQGQGSWSAKDNSKHNK